VWFFITLDKGPLPIITHQAGVLGLFIDESKIVWIIAQRRTDDRGAFEMHPPQAPDSFWGVLKGKASNRKLQNVDEMKCYITHAFTELEKQT
jgi:hypothetical protein